MACGDPSESDNPGQAATANISGSLTFTGSDTGSIGVSFPAGTIVYSQALNSLIIVGGSCVVQPADICTYTGSLSINFDQENKIDNLFLAWIVDDSTVASKSYGYKLDCTKIGADCTGISIDVATGVISFNNVLLNPNAGTMALAVLSLTGDFTTTGVTLPEYIAPAVSQMGSITVASADIGESNTFGFTGDFSPENYSFERSSHNWSTYDGTYSTVFAYHEIFNTFIFQISTGASRDIYSYYLSCGSNPPECDGITIDLTTNSLTLDQVVFPLPDQSQISLQTNLATEPATISGTLHMIVN